MSPRMHADHRPGPTLADLQQRVEAWIGQFEEGYWPPLSMLARFTEEVAELAREINHSFGYKPKKAEEPPGDIALEVADIIFVLVCLCNSLRIDLGDAFERVMQKYDARDLARWTPRSDLPAEPSPGGARRSQRPPTTRRSAGSSASQRPARRTRVRRNRPRSTWSTCCRCTAPGVTGRMAANPTRRGANRISTTDRAAACGVARRQRARLAAASGIG